MSKIARHIMLCAMWSVFVLLLVSSTSDVVAQGLTGYHHVADAAIRGHNNKRLRNVSVQDCMNACNTEHWCKSFDYHKADRWCDLSDKNAADVGGLKTNYPRNPYDHYAKAGIEEVPIEGYRHVANAAIRGHNKKRLHSISVQGCMAACNGESWCKSFDYHKADRWCDLSDKNAADVGGLKTNYAGNPYDHYEKQ